jgi:ABC-type multidrug transport system ATPase subunit
MRPPFPLPQSIPLLAAHALAMSDPLAYRLRTFYCGGDTPELPWLTVQEFLDWHMALYPAADVQLLNAQLAAFGVMDTLPQAVTTLSLGQHKKLQLAEHAQAGAARIVLTSHLDPDVPLKHVIDLG